jgi:hypothetical protein
VRVTAFGRIQGPVDVRAVPLRRLDGLRPADVATPAGAPQHWTGSTTVLARFGGRCVVERNGVVAIDCPPAGARARAPTQSWWLEVSCATGEGWGQVDPTRYRIDHFPSDAPVR